ncbi:MAG: CopD family protein, partial [Marinomonas sp.]
SLLIVWVLGLALAFSTGAFTQGWFHVKLLLVLVLTGYHGWFVGQTKKMVQGERPLSEKQLRLFGEVPGLLLVLIVILVVIRPF